MLQKNLLKNSTIVVTGANGLLGKSIMSYCKAAGANLIGIDLKKPENIDIHFIKGDVTNPQFIKDTLNSFNSSPLQGWVNAAYPRTEDWGKSNFYNTNSWEKNTQMQLVSLCQTLEDVGSYLSSFKGSSIVSLASIYGVLAPQFEIYEGTDLTMPAPYSAIKAGLINFSRYMAAKLGPKGVRVNCVSPGGIEDRQPQKFIKQYSEKTMLKRMGKPEDIAACVAFLLSDQASYITGQNIMVDGGWSAM